MKTILVTLTTYLDVPLDTPDEEITDDFVWDKLSERGGLNEGSLLLEYEVYKEEDIILDEEGA